jgi:AcrR family transcriptional regulator
VSTLPEALPTPKTQVGRPRNRELDKAVLQAVRELLAQDGYHALSIHKVTLRSGVHVRTITRRWNTKAEIVAAAILGGDDPLFFEDAPRLPTGHLKNDLRELIERNLQFLADPPTRAALPALISEIDTNQEVWKRFNRRQQEWTATIRTVLQHAVQSGDAPKRVVEQGHLLPNIIGGTTFNLQFLPAVSRNEALIDELVDFLLASLGANSTKS